MGYYVPETAKEDKEEGEDEGDDDAQLEMQLAAWKITRNYIKDPWNLRLIDRGNPTGIVSWGYDLRRAPGGATKGTKSRSGARARARLHPADPRNTHATTSQSDLKRSRSTSGTRSRSSPGSGDG
jgi:hypothetical protein